MTVMYCTVLYGTVAAPPSRALSYINENGAVVILTRWDDRMSTVPNTYYHVAVVNREMKIMEK